MMSELASNGTPLDVLTANDWDTPYGPGKFDSVAAEKIHSWTLDGNQDEECGNSTDWYWRAALFRDERVILEEVSSGAVYALRYQSEVELNAAWSMREEAWEDAVHAECAAKRECEGCFNCESF